MSGPAQHVLIVGAGLAGSLMACYLAKQGRRVSVYERRPDPRAQGFVGGRSINLALSARGIAGLAGVGLDQEILAQAIRMPGRMIHPVAGATVFQPYSANPADAINSISRSGLNLALIDAAARNSGVSFHFDRPCLDIDPGAPAAIFQSPSGPERITADLIIGADGAFSAVRGHLQKTDRFDYSQSYLPHGYKELHIPALGGPTLRGGSSGGPTLRGGSSGGPTLRGGSSGSRGRDAAADLRRFTAWLGPPGSRTLSPKYFTGRDPYPPGMRGPAPDLIHRRHDLPRLRLPDATYFVTWHARDGVEFVERERDAALDAVLHFDGERGRVYAATVMSNHVHVILRPFDGHDLDQWLESIKRFSATTINKARGASGHLWQSEHFDHIVRDRGDFTKVVRYLLENPVEAGAARQAESYDWTFVHRDVWPDGPDAQDPAAERRATPGPAAERRATQWAMQPNALHIWPRGGSMMIALPNPDQSFTCTLFWPWGGEGDHSFANLKTPQDVDRHFQQHYPDAVPLMPTLTEDYFNNPTSSLVTIRCWPWQAAPPGRVVLIGDAAHAIVPFFGQGMNAAFEDCLTLARALEEHGSDTAAALDAYQHARKPNADAIADMALENFVEMRDKVGRPEFLYRKKVEQAIHQLFPGRVTPLYNLVSFSTVPYTEALARGRALDATLDAIVAALPGEAAAGMPPAQWTERVRQLAAGTLPA